MMGWRVLIVGAFVAVIALGTLLGSRSGPSGTPPGAQLHDPRVIAPLGTGLRGQMLALLNFDRARHDRKALKLDEDLAHYAHHHSQRMAERGELFHTSEAKLRELLKGKDWSIAGENIGVGETLKVIEQAFMDSPAHRENNLRKAYRYAGVGVYDDGDRLWVTLVFYG